MTIEILQKSGFFATKSSVQEAMQYADQIIGAISPEDRLAATTATYVLYDTVVEHYNLKEGEENA